MFTASLVLDPTLLRGLRAGLSSWLDRAGVSTAVRESVVLATHEAAAHAMERAESGSTIDVTAMEDADAGVVVHVRSAGGWESLPAAHGLALVTGLVSNVSLQASTTIRLRHAL